jgi:hypothetical protein
MANEVKPLLKTLRYRVKDRVSRKHLGDVTAARNILRLGRQALAEGSSTLSA